MDGFIREIQSEIESRENYAALYDQANFNERAETLDFLETDVIDRIEVLRGRIGWSPELAGLLQAAEGLRTRLEALDEALFRGLRHEIASGDCTGSALKERITSYAGTGKNGASQPGEGYDQLDGLVNGLLLAEPAPEAPARRDPEMYFYQPTPVRVVLELLDLAGLRQGDVFYDIGSGLGQVSILVHLLSGVQVKAVEIEPVYCDYARRCAINLNIARVQFINLDAREVDYSDGTVFYLYTPFVGSMLEQVLGKLRRVSTKKRIRLYTYGPCTRQVARAKWLQRLDKNVDGNGLATFRGG
ncbi:MAG TPA: class I SAM-dependent methyltransferase [Anaerolineales bacterium]